MKPILAFVLLSFLALSTSFAQKLSSEETKLYNLLMQYRREKGLPSIPLSSSLSYVAQLHVKDLEANFTNSGYCNMHSWSDKGVWSSCCYTSDHVQAKCMWNKPRELTNYKGNGYEISFGSWGAPADAVSALAGWKGSPGHNNVIINNGIWNEKWNAIGVGIYGGYAVVWFGREPDEISN